MSPEARERLFGVRHAFDQPITLVVTLALAALLLLTPAVIGLLARLGRIDAKLRTELMLRYYSWLVLVPLILLPILLGAAWTILGVGILSLFCYREYARATGLFREKTVSLVVVLGIVALTFTELDHWYRLFVALFPFTVGILAIAAILRDQPQGYIQRVGLGMLVAETNVPVVPCHLDGCFRALTPHQHWPRPERIRLRIGAPLNFADVPNNREGWQRIAAAMQESVKALASATV